MRVIITPKAQEHYRKLPKLQQAKIKRKLLLIEENPYIGKKLEGELFGQLTVRAWPYRIIYEIDKNKIVYITSIIHRQGAYKR